MLVCDIDKNICCKFKEISYICLALTYLTQYLQYYNPQKLPFSLGLPPNAPHPQLPVATAGTCASGLSFSLKPQNALKKETISKMFY